MYGWKYLTCMLLSVTLFWFVSGNSPISLQWEMLFMSAISYLTKVLPFTPQARCLNCVCASYSKQALILYKHKTDILQSLLHVVSDFCETGTCIWMERCMYRCTVNKCYWRFVEDLQFWTCWKSLQYTETKGPQDLFCALLRQIS